MAGKNNQEENSHVFSANDDDDESVEPRDTSERDTSGRETSSEMSSSPSPPGDDAAEAGPSCPDRSTGAIPKKGKQDPISSQMPGSGSSSETESEDQPPEAPPQAVANYLKDINFEVTHTNLFLLLQPRENQSSSGGSGSSAAPAVQPKPFTKDFLFSIITGRYGGLQPYRERLLDVLNEYRENNMNAGAIAPREETSPPRGWSPGGSSIGSDEVFSPNQVDPGEMGIEEIEANRQLAEVISRMKFSMNVQERSRKPPGDCEAAAARSETDSPYPDSQTSSGEGETAATSLSPSGAQKFSMNVQERSRKPPGDCETAAARSETASPYPDSQTSSGEGETASTSLSPSSAQKTAEMTSPSTDRQEKRRAQTSSDEAQNPKGSPKKKLVTKKHFPRNDEDSTDADATDADATDATDDTDDDATDDATDDGATDDGQSLL